MQDGGRCGDTCPGSSCNTCLTPTSKEQGSPVGSVACNNAACPDIGPCCTDKMNLVSQCTTQTERNMGVVHRMEGRIDQATEESTA